MKKTMLTLMVILVIPALLLCSFYVLDDVARRNAEQDHMKMMETLLPGGKNFVPVPYEEDDSVIRSVHQASNGYVIEAATQGYASEIVMLIGVDNDGKVTGLVTYRAEETPGLGSGILTDHKFLSQFLNKTGSFAIGTVESDAFSGATDTGSSTGNEISVDGITGATVSSKAVVRCVNAAIAYVTGTDIDSSASTWGG